LRFGPLLGQILDRHGYSQPGSNLLGETSVLSSLLGSMLKFDGVFTLQANGKGLVNGCRCSRDQVAGTLVGLPKYEFLEMLEAGVVSVKCEFCGEFYEFDEPSLESLFVCNGFATTAWSS